MSKELPITKFDQLTINDSLQMYKAMIPFLDPYLQKTFSMIIRINELTQTMDFYNNPKNTPTIISQSINSTHTNPTELLNNENFINTVTKYAPERYISLFNNFKNMTRLFNLFNTVDFSKFDFSGTNTGSDFNPDNTCKHSKNSCNSSNSDCNGGTSDDSSASNDNIKNILRSLMTEEQFKKYNSYINSFDLDKS